MRKQFNYTYIHCDRCFKQLKEDEIFCRELCINPTPELDHRGQSYDSWEWAKKMAEDEIKRLYPNEVPKQHHRRYELCKKCAKDFDEKLREIRNMFGAAPHDFEPPEEESKKKGKK